MSLSMDQRRPTLRSIARSASIGHVIDSAAYEMVIAVAARKEGYPSFAVAAELGLGIDQIDALWRRWVTMPGDAAARLAAVVMAVRLDAREIRRAV